jgi:Methyltransferase domain
MPLLPLVKASLQKLFQIKKIATRNLNRPDWRDLRTLQPISDVFGSDRGLSVGRYYIEKFLSHNREAVTGHVLEVAESRYTEKFGPNVQKSDVLHVNHDNPGATLVADLTDLKTLPKDRYDCFICTQTLNFIYDFKSAVKGIFYLLKDGGTVLATVHGISQISEYDMLRWGDFWRFTDQSARRIFSDVFGTENVKIDYYGNVLTCVAFLEGIASEELTREELDYTDRNYQLIITIRAQKRLL